MGTFQKQGKFMPIVWVYFESKEILCHMNVDFKNNKENAVLTHFPME